MYFSYIHWRYWKIGTEKFKEIVSQDISYTSTCSLDVYHPNRTSQAPIILFLYGGGWSTGSKVYYTTFANTLRELGYVVVVPDYRKYPEGHSAGAHLVAQVVLSDVIEKVKYYQAIAPGAQQTSHVSEKHDPTKHDRGTELPHDFLPPIEGLLLQVYLERDKKIEFAGVYDIQAHLLFETARGVEKLSVMTRVMGSTPEGYIANSPMHLIEKHADLFATSGDTLDLWPRILFLHGQKDATVSMDQSAHMFNAIGKVLPMECRDEVDVRMRFYKRMNHGEPVTALMLDMFAKKSLQKSLIRDIKEFIDVPAFEEDEF
ncbi:alpha/beta-hydrolase [Rhizopus microsporus var. microsporus]|uniref:Alpha/beta-hydrolase n=1 Tax=Rhizopus microsporus var. microsporus TaxID=86635 RepID=A0A1X0QZ29_RHIZD|nr:alpha/beta-hydrolase [Rhizopus microsporus var. microsporus]